MNRQYEILKDVLNIPESYNPTLNKTYMIEPSEITKAMDIHTKEQIIAFAKWLSNHPLDFQPASQSRWIGLDNKTYCADELYNLYLSTNSEQTKISGPVIGPG